MELTLGQRPDIGLVIKHDPQGSSGRAFDSSCLPFPSLRDREERGLC